MIQKYDSFVFTHIPKCGGTSFRNYLNQSAIDSSIHESDIYIPGENGLSTNKNPGQIKGTDLQKFKESKYLILGLHAKFNFHEQFQPKLDCPFYYTILREPITRYVSHYNYFNKHLGYNDCKNLDLEELPIEKFSRLTAMHGNLMVKYMLGLDNNAIVNNFELVSKAKNNLLNGYAAFGILEQLEKSLDVLKSKSPSWLKWTGSMKELNSNNNYSETNLSDERINIIIRSNSLDVSFYENAIESFSLL